MSVSVFPRRAFVAAVLSGVTAASAIGLGLYGGLSMPESQDFGFSRGVKWAAQDGERLRGFLARALEDDRIHVTIFGHSGRGARPGDHDGQNDGAGFGGRAPSAQNGW